jgi:cytoskeleton protein RodZ
MTKVTRLTLDDEGGLDRRRIHLREISGDLDTPLDAVGQDLRAARLRRGDDLAAVSKVLKIRKDHLEALEEDRIDALPGRTYAVGFVRSYADYLGLDAVQCVERFKAEIAGRTDEATPQITVIDEDEDRRMPQGWKIMAVFVLALVVYGAYQLAASVNHMLSEPAVGLPPSSMTQRPVVVVKKTPPVQVTVVQADTPPAAVGTSVPAVGTSPSPNTAAPNGVVASTALQANPQQASGGIPQQASSEPSALPPTPLPQGQTYGDQNKTSRVLLRMRTAAKILVQGPDGRVFMNRTLKAGDSYRVPNMVGLTLTTSNAGAVELDLDGLLMGVAGKNQETAEALSLDPQSIMDRYNGNHGG